MQNILSALSLALYLSFSLIFLLETHFKSIDSCCIFALVSFFCELKICCRCIYFRLFGINRSCVRFVVVVVRCACYPDAFCLLMHFFTCFPMQFKVVLCIFMTLLKSFVLQPFAVSHTHTHTLNLPLMPRVSRCTSVYSRCSCAFFTHSQIENVRPHFQLYHIISYSCCALDLFLPFFLFVYSFRSQFAATFGILSDTLYRFCFAALLLYLSFIEIEKCSFCARFAA